MTNLVRIKHNDISLGRALPYSIYDEGGKLLLRAGMVISMPRYLDALMAQGAYFDQAEVSQAAVRKKAPEREKQSVFERVEGLLLNLKHVFNTFSQEPDRIDVPKRVLHLAQQLQQACDEDADASLAVLHLDQTTPYRVHHHLLCATLVELMARELRMGQEERLPLVCGALSHDIGLVAMGDELSSVKTPLSAAQQAEIRAHAGRGADILAGCGVKDPLWLEAVRQHHERLDGSGYPHGRKGDDIAMAGRLLAVADIYSAMIRPRPYRGNAYFPQNALRDIFLDRSKVDVNLTQLAIKCMGMMPPGSIMRLQNNEIAVVKARGSTPSSARVFSVYNPSGMPLMTPVERNIQNPAFAVAGKVNYDECRSAEVIMRRLWSS